MTEQLPLFQRKNFHATLTTGIPITPPSAGMTVLSLLPAYYAYLQAQGYSSYTPGDFCSDLKKFGLFVPGKAIKEITHHDIRAWVSLLKNSMTEKTITRKLSALNNFFSWLVSDKVLEVNPAAAIPNYKVTSPLPEVLFESECTQLLKVASDDCRSYLLLMLLLETGIKTEELMHLQVCHIDVSNKYAPEMWVKHSGKKVKKDRKLKLPPEIVPVVSEYIATYKIGEALFPVSQRLLRDLLQDVADRAGLKKKVSMQMLRDTCAVRLVKRGEPLETVLLKLGFSESTWEDAKVKYTRLTGKAM